MSITHLEDISGCRGEFDASESGDLFQDDAGTTPAAGGDPVGLWVNRAIPGDDGQQATGGSKPVVVANAVNSLTALEFTAGQGLNLFDFTGVAMSTLTIAMAFMMTDDLGGSADQNPLCLGDANNVNEVLIFEAQGVNSGNDANNMDVAYSFGQDVTHTLTDIAAFDTWLIWIVTINGTEDATQAYLENTAASMTPPGGDDAILIQFGSSTGTGIGCIGGGFGGVFNFSGQIGQIGVWDKVLDGTERADVVSYLQRWIPAAPPSGFVPQIRWF